MRGWLTRRADRACSAVRMPVGRGMRRDADLAQYGAARAAAGGGGGGGRTVRHIRRGSTARSKPASLRFLRMDSTGQEQSAATLWLRDPVQARLM